MQRVIVDEVSFVGEPDLLHHASRRRVPRKRERHERLDAELVERVRGDCARHLGRISLRPQFRTHDVPQLDLSAPAMDAAPPDEVPGVVSEHPNAEAVLAPVVELPREPFARLIRALRLRVEGGDDALVRVQRPELVEVALDYRPADEPRGGDQP